MVYYPGTAGVIYNVLCQKEVLCKSDEYTLARKPQTYVSHEQKYITAQLGLSFRYDATKEETEYHEASVLKMPENFRLRPCCRPEFMPPIEGKECKQVSETDRIYDLGMEQVGLLKFCFESTREQEVIISFGEHLEGGTVNRLIDGRDFSISYRAKEGKNEFFYPFRRLGCRYLEVQSEDPLRIQQMSIVPTVYVVNEQERPVLTPIQEKIYDICIRTLQLCMHEHYEDCPWREQALYAMDSRNQMLCGYYAFEEYEFARSNLELISKDRREDGFLSICYPTKMNGVIPSFSLHYITACKEYLQHSQDEEFIREIYPKLSSIMLTFINRRRKGLIPQIEGATYWNFYEWQKGLSGRKSEKTEYDVILNALVSIALQNMADISEQLGIANDYREIALDLNHNIRAVFWDEEKGICYNFPEHTSYSQLGNSLAILSGAILGKEARTLCERIQTDEEMTAISLSMQCFKYDAWLKTDQKQYREVILQDIERIYIPMVESGSTTVWETEIGASDFHGAGSLCHGWSAMPIYYYHKLLNKKKERDEAR
jgi:hypothetical protein